MQHAAKQAVRISGLGPSLKGILGRQPVLAPAIKRGRTHGWDAAARWLLSADHRTVLQDSGLLVSLAAGINTDIDVELLLVSIRKILLCEAQELLKDNSVQRFICAFVKQCLNNEYIFHISGEEKNRLKTMGLDLSGTMAKNGRTAEKLLLISMYRPLHEVFDGDSKEVGDLNVNPDFKALVRNHMDSHIRELEIARALEQVGTIQDDTSRRVGAQYEVYPYPRWIDLVAPAPGSRKEVLRNYFDESELKFMDRPFEVLVAGCGTGRKAIQVALGYGEQASVLGADLSCRSLAYATRMAEKYGATNIRFLRVDILNLPSLKRQFDIVECTGVLHHMADPLAGWRSLVRVTRPGGIMHISMYSELARRDIWKIREETNTDKEAKGADFIRQYRHDLMLSNPERVDHLPTRSDFFDLSRCKDLLFHVNEHCFTIPQLAQCFASLRLEFRGFEAPRLDDGTIWNEFPGGPNLDRLWEFEQRNPAAFGNLYEMWVRT